jgi:hypothetical protein
MTIGTLSPDEKDLYKIVFAIRQLQEGRSNISAANATAALNPFVGDSGSGGTKGLVPAPAAGDAAAQKFLSAGGGWGRATQFKVGTFTKNMTDASGNQAFTGVGFKPKAVVFFAGVNAGMGDSKGVDDGTTSGYAADDYADVAGGQAAGTGASIVIVPATGKSYVGKIASMDADGFTIAWTRTSTPTGTINVTYLALGPTS